MVMTLNAKAAETRRLPITTRTLTGNGDAYHLDEDPPVAGVVMTLNAKAAETRRLPITTRTLTGNGDAYHLDE
ncbi:hypothetical protein C5706_33120, partial [Klebsiella pneumoniae]